MSFLQRSARGLRGLRLRSGRLCLDARREAVYWATASRGVAGEPRLRGWGRFPREPDEPLARVVARLAASGALSGATPEAALGSADLEHRRLALPALGAREAAAVGARRAAELARELPAQAVAGFARAPGRGPRPLWLCAAPLALATDLQERWRDAGLELARIASQHLALGQLARLLPASPDASLTGIVDFEAEHATCVVADARGWLFSRQIPLKFAGEKRLQGGDPSPAEEEPEEEGFTQAERITTELARTLRYVQSILALGSVGRIVLTGEVAGLRELAATLGVNLELPCALLGEAIAAGPAAGADPGAAVAIGLALSPPDAGNLLPERARRQRQVRVLHGRLRLALAAALALCALAGAGFAARRAGLRAELERVEGEWRAAAGERTELSRTREERARAATLATALAALDRPQPPVADALEVLGRLAPASTWIERLSLEERDGAWRAVLLVEGLGESVSAAAAAVSALARALDESPLFAVDRVERQPLPREVRGAGEPAGERVRFRLEARLAPLEASGRAVDPRGAGHG